MTDEAKDKAALEEAARAKLIGKRFDFPKAVRMMTELWHKDLVAAKKRLRLEEQNVRASEKALAEAILETMAEHVGCVFPQDLRYSISGPAGGSPTFLTIEAPEPPPLQAPPAAPPALAEKLEAPIVPMLPAPEEPPAIEKRARKGRRGKTPRA